MAEEMYSSNYYRSSTSPYRAPSKNANSFDYGRYRGGNPTTNNNKNNNTDFGNETWPLDEVIDKIDLKSESDYNPTESHHHSLSHQHEPYSYRNTSLQNSNTSKPPQNLNASSYSFGEPYRNRSNSPRKSPSRFERISTPDPDMVYSAFPDRTQSWATSFNSNNYNKHNNSYEPYKLKDNGFKSYDSNNNYVSDDQWSLDDGFKGPMVRDVAIQCNLKKYHQSLHAAIHEPSVERVITQKPPIKVIKSSPSGVVSTFSSVPKLSGAAPRSSPYNELDFDSYEPSPQNDVIYTQVDKKHPSRDNYGRVPSLSKLNSSVNSNLNVVFKAPVNDSIVSHNSTASRLLPSTDGKQYDVRSKEYGFNVGNPVMPRVNMNNYESRHMFNSSRDLNEMPPTEKEILEETISISNASEDSYRIPKHSRPQYMRDRDDLSYTGLSVASGNSSNYRHASPSRYDRFPVTKTLPSPYGTMEKSRDSKTKIKKKKSSRKTDPENVLLSNNSLRLKSSKQPSGPTSDRLYKSNADLRDSYLADETRGGLAAAYKHRQQMARTPTSDRQRALSLSRMSSAFDDHDDHRSTSMQPSRHMSHLHLGGRGSRLSDSSTGTFQRSASRSQLHERDPIVMYIPTASRESPVKQGILRNNSTKQPAISTLPSKGKKASDARKSKETSVKSSSRANVRDADKDNAENINTSSKKSKSSKEKKSSKKSAAAPSGTSASAVDLSRSQSMPKDTKFNWLSKLKLKSK